MDLKNESKKEFEELYLARAKQAKKIMVTVFGIIGVLFLALGLIFTVADVKDAETGVSPGSIFMPLGGGFIAIGLVFFYIPFRPDYDKYVERRTNGKIMETDLYIEVQLLRREIELLQARVAELENQND